MRAERPVGDILMKKANAHQSAKGKAETRIRGIQRRLESLRLASRRSSSGISEGNCFAFSSPQ